MRISLIVPYSDIQSIGVRILSACLKRAGHKPRLVFLCGLNFISDGKRELANEVPPDSLIRELIHLCEDSDLIGFSLMTDEFTRIRSITQAIKSELSIPVIWGGVHPTIRPEECLQYADMVCVGEGEYALPELMTALEGSHEDISIPGIWLKKNGKMISNPPWPLVKDLDLIPFPDYDCTDSYILDKGSVKPLTPELLKEYMQQHHYDLKSGTYGIMSSRGCPYKCSYCGNSFYRELYKGNYSVRRRSMENVVEELVKVKESFPYIKGVRFHDDTFLAASH